MGAQAGYNARVAARTAVARTLQAERYATLRREVGLVDRDLAEIVTRGVEGERFDRLQKEGLASQRARLKRGVEAREKVDEGGEKLRNRLPAITLDLAEAEATIELARWLAGVVFERYRIRVVVPARDGTAPAEAPPPEPERTRVERRDRLAQAESLTQLTDSLLEPGREPIVAALEARGMPRAELETLAADARALVEALGGLQQLQPEDATRREAEAVTAQQTRWRACRRMIRAAAATDESLAAMLGKC